MNGSAIAGLAIMIVSETATLAGLDPFPQWNTPIAWTGFILFADGVVYRAAGTSWLRASPGEFAFLALVSVPLWLVFEFFNLFIRNWHYVGLPENAALRTFGYAWSFATIWPAIFLGAELVAVWIAGRGPRSQRERPPASAGAAAAAATAPAASGVTAMEIAIGLAMLLWPLLWPSPYLAAPVWLGFILLLDPINARMGEPSLEGDVRHGRYDRAINLSLSGLLCGILWEFWNYWASAKWHYTVPIMENLKIFEMPVPGYLGFPAFALECFTMYVFVRAIVVRLTGARFSRSVGCVPVRGR